MLNYDPWYGLATIFVAKTDPSGWYTVGLLHREWFLRENLFLYASTKCIFFIVHVNVLSCTDRGNVLFTLQLLLYTCILFKIFEHCCLNDDLLIIL